MQAVDLPQIYKILQLWLKRKTSSACLVSELRISGRFPSVFG